MATNDNLNGAQFANILHGNVSYADMGHNDYAYEDSLQNPQRVSLVRNRLSQARRDTHNANKARKRS